MVNLVPLRVNTGETVMVADIMVVSLKKYLKIFPEFSIVKKIILFGSTLEERCCEESDVDLYVVHDGTRKEFSDFLYEILEKCDVAVYDDILGSTEEELNESSCCFLHKVREEGKVIYDREFRKKIK